MAVLFSPWGNQQFFDENGDPAVGWLIETYAAGSSEPVSTYTSATGATAQTNPVVLDSLGLPVGGEIWLTDGVLYKFVLTDAGGVVKKTVDNIAGVSNSGSAVSQFQSSGVTPTYISATSFSLAGDQTNEFHVGRRAQFTTTAGTAYGTIATAAYASLTTITMTMDDGQSLDAGLSGVNLGILRADNSALPNSDASRTALGAAKSGANSDITSLTGTTTNDSAAAGKIGEYVSSTRVDGSSLAMTHATAIAVTSIEVTAGDWDVSGHAGFSTTASTTVSRLGAMFNTSVATSNDLEGLVQNIYQPSSVLNTPGVGIAVIAPNTARFSVAETTTIYLVAFGAFSASTLNVFGHIHARRVR